MHIHRFLLVSLSTYALIIILFACSDNTDSSEGPPIDGGSPGTNDPQLPPITGEADMEAWLSAEFYKQWTCESAPHGPRTPSPHGNNRICSNTTLSNFTGTGEFPTGSAGVKELYNSSNNLVGYAVYRKVANGTDGNAWYWYESVNGAVVVDGINVSGCVGCHSGAGTMGYSGHDFVYTQVQAGS